jgi:hypothetical protein
MKEMTFYFRSLLANNVITTMKYGRLPTNYW